MSASFRPATATSSSIAVDYIAHVRERDGAIQPVSQHLIEVAKLSERFASKIKLPSSGMLIGRVHDLGKYADGFQHYIRAATGMRGREEQIGAEALKGKIDHATAGAQVIWEKLHRQSVPAHYAAQMLAACVASHHSRRGITDFVATDGSSPFLRRISKPEDKSHVAEAMGKGDGQVGQVLEELSSSDAIVQEFLPVLREIAASEDNELLRQFHFGLLTRFLFSCLLDADRLSTANFEKPKSGALRNTGISTNWGALAEQLEMHLGDLKCRNEVDALRNSVSQSCLDASSRSKGLFTLTVPTGGGKTLASLRFALNHARHHSPLNSDSPIERIIYVLPYTTIIDQNAAAVRKIVGHENVLEHHSNLVPENDTWRNRVLSENWDAPIVFTTSVQFLNAFFAAPTNDARRMHQSGNSIIIFDEIQTLPLKTIHLFNNAMNFLIQRCGSSVVFCTATQPLLESVNPHRGAARLRPESEIMPDIHALFQSLRRTEIRDLRQPGGWSFEQVAKLAREQVRENGSTLIVVNTKASALTLYDILRDPTSVQIYHLSTNMCPAHRKDVLKRIDKCLYATTPEPVICISTQLIEAGVDIDFGSVIRYLAGLDSIGQAAGRCNRNGRRTASPAPVLVVNPAQENIDMLPDIQKGQEVAKRVLDDFRATPDAMDHDLLSPAAMRQFYRYYFFQRAEEMIYSVSAKDHQEIGRDANLLDLLSENKASVSEYERQGGRKPNFPLRHALSTASKAFCVIDAPTRGIIVPYREKGRCIIGDLAAALTSTDFPLEKQGALLRRAQQYSVNVFPHVLKKLDENRCIREVQKDSGIYYLDERHYNDAVGLTIESSMGLAFLNV